MSKQIWIFIIAASLAFGALAATPRQRAEESPGISYLGVLEKGYPARLVARELARARVKVHAIQDGMVLFSINDESRLTPFFNKHLPFLDGVYLDRQALLKDAKAAKTRIGCKFMALCSGKSGQGSVLRPMAGSDKMSRYFLQGGDGVSREMLAIDKMISRFSYANIGLPKGADDDAYEENDEFSSAAAITPGTYSNLWNLDDDWYKVTVSEGQDLAVSATYEDDLGNLYLYLYDSSQSNIGYSGRVEYGHRRAVAADLPAGDYYIYVYGYGELTYEMTVQTGNVLGVVTGNVTDTTAAPIANVEIDAYTMDWYSCGYTYTEADGDYALDQYPGQVYIYFSGQSAGNYLDEYYNNKSPEQTPDEVTVTANATTSGINAELADGGSISGRVLDSSGAGTDSLSVYAYDSDNNYSNSVQPDSDGYYTIGGLLTDTYKVRYDPWDNHVEEWYNNKDSFYTGDPVSVTAGSDTPGINAQLALGGHVSGHVQDILGNEIVDIPVRAYDTSGNELESDWTDANGDYTISQVPAGSVKVFFEGSYYDEFTDEWYNDKRNFASADPVTVTSGSETSGINAVLVEGGTISGRVTESGGSGLDDILVRVYDNDAHSQGYAWTDSDGYYTYSGLYPGSYKVWFDTYYNSDYGAEWYDDKGSFDTGDSVAVASGGTTGNIDAVLDTGGDIMGYVANPSGGTIQGVVVALYNPDHMLICSSLSDRWGYYGFYGVPAGSYKVYFDPAYADGQYIPEWYLDKASFDAASTVVLNAGSELNLANTILSLGKRLTVTSPTAGTTWFTKSLLPITWSKIGTQNANVKIQLYKGTSAVSTISLKTANDGSFDWTISSGLAAATNYRIKITTKDNLLSAFSGYFTIARPSITITAPVAGAVWGKGTAQTITWTKTGTQAATVKIQLFKGTTLISTLASSTGNDGSFDWTVPAGQSTATNYKIKIATTDSAVKATSGQFTIN